jgi:hypothetical protein
MTPPLLLDDEDDDDEVPLLGVPDFRGCGCFLATGDLLPPTIRSFVLAMMKV